MIQTRPAALPDITELHVHFLTILPSIEQYAELAHRHVVNFHDREDAIAETIALTWAWYYKLARRGKHTLASPTMLAHAAVRSVRAGQLLCSSNMAWRKEVLINSHP
jgi:hypothetical protein